MNEVICIDNKYCELKLGATYKVVSGGLSSFFIKVNDGQGVSGYNTNRFREKTKQDYVKDFIKRL